MTGLEVLGVSALPKSARPGLILQLVELAGEPGTPVSPIKPTSHWVVPQVGRSPGYRPR